MCRCRRGERETISRELAAGRSHRGIALLVGRHHSVISREIARNGGNQKYRAVIADRRARRMRTRPKERKLERAGRVRDYVMERLALRWSPGQIATRLRADHPDDEEMCISHEAIYQTLFVQGRGQLRALLYRALRSGRAKRVSPAKRVPAHDRIAGMVSISERPKEADDRAVPGFWEGDLILGSACKSQILTLVERQTRFVMLIRVPHDRSTDRVATLLSLKMRTLPAFLKNSLTWDRGTEMGEHARFTTASGMPVYFCDPHSPWQRGSNENTNGLLRQYFPKGTDLSVHSQAHLDEVARELNGRPRMTLDWATPTEKLNQLLINHGVATIT
ncbi:IS30 family transposase [Actinokineospora iranica]|uniref:IS30 family transposase n=1 Tax=Actinokineospora iranica TaxID=1271860 RepID=UPI000B8324DF|nr:IS30 family transposase [Actinokineospora iranica]